MVWQRLTIVRLRPLLHRVNEAQKSLYHLVFRLLTILVFVSWHTNTLSVVDFNSNSIR